jgi:Na+-translocating ferredoxin:NAD+ oxidoreductase RnfA subunit
MLRVVYALVPVLASGIYFITGIMALAFLDFSGMIQLGR